MKTGFFSVSAFVLLLSLFHATPVVTPDDIRDDVLTATNNERQKKGLRPLVINEGLNRIAQGHSDNMAKKKVPFSHDGFQQRYTAARAVLKDVYSCAENVSFGPRTGQVAVDSWMGSKHHKDNILGDFTTIGIGVAVDNNGTHYFTQFFCKQ